jgi:DNA-binding GntR family transcriptional regulator
MAPSRRQAAGSKAAVAIKERPTAGARDETVPTFSRAGWLAEILRERILNGVYAPGERIREVELRSEFGFSNGPTREALQLIVAGGLAERAPWQGVRVVSLTEQEIVDIFQLRAALLEYAAELAARFGPADILAQAPDIRRKLTDAFAKRKKGDARTFFNGTLTRWILAAAGNAAITEAFDRGVVKARIYINASIRRAIRPDRGFAREGWVNDLIDAIVAQDPKRARVAARGLTLQTLRDLDIEGRV